MPRRKLALIVAGAISVGVAIPLMLFLVPVPQHFSLTGAANYDPNFTCEGINTAKSTEVTFTWSASSPVYFFVVSCSANQVAYEGNGTVGFGAFVSVGGMYQFGASCPEGSCVPASVEGYFTGPIASL